MKLEEKLVSLRKEKGLSQQAAAEKIGVSRQAISRWEVGAAVPSYENLKCICKLYGVSADFLIDDDREEIATQAADVTTRFQEPEEPPKAGSEQNKRPRRRIGYAIAVACILAFLVGTMLICKWEFNQDSGDPSMDDTEYISQDDMNRDANDDGFETFPLEAGW
jgi:transcriptional regulator with XRE-family HTH domain